MKLWIVPHAALGQRARHPSVIGINTEANFGWL
jgi:hypothetical protein